jgi:hypothetical protein
MSRIEKLADEYGLKWAHSPILERQMRIAFMDGYRRALKDMQAMDAPLCWWGQHDFGELMTAVAKELEG